MKSTKQILLDAAELISAEGWAQNEYGSSHRGWCILGAVYSVPCDAVDLMLRARRDLFASLGDPVGWNDTEGRTAEEVIAKLREVAESLV